MSERPLSSPMPDVVGVRPLAVLNAVVTSFCACAATASVWCRVPVKEPLGAPEKPVMDEPGDRPTSPVTTVGPVLVTVLAPSTPNGAAVPTFSGPSSTVPATAAPEPNARSARESNAAPATPKPTRLFVEEWME